MLDSSHPYTTSARFDILTAAPWCTALPTVAPGADERQCRHFFEEMTRFHREHYQNIPPVSPDIPFCGGVLGYLGYELGMGLHNIQGETPQLPAAQLCAYDWAIVQDHVLRRTALVSHSRISNVQRQAILQRLRRPAARTEQAFRVTGEFTSSLSATAYREAFERIQDYIHAGDCYQVNLTQRFSATCTGDAWQAYRRLRAIAAAPFAAYLQLADNTSLLCLSPERFLSLHDYRVETSPIKGTRPRFKDAALDEAARDELSRSQKDRAENLMIVDLLRNDLGRCCLPGSIQVDRLFELQSFPAVHHLVSTISGELRNDRNAWDLLKDCFPGGSITGAPKRRAMQIIHELEPHQRLAYCGSVVYISADGRMDSNIAIRSLLCTDGHVHCWGGGGIVADSTWQQEYQEAYDKVGIFIRSLEQIDSD
ncbi:MAG: aminodeoxychorismate synthase component I [Halioglobus sp.]|nr:aminodeoxychorismate synthase component I [Halioglobus sp.]